MRLLSIVGAIFVFVVLAVLLLRDLPPPTTLTFAAGSRDGGYWSVAERYREELARDGITLEILETGGSIDNLELLEARKADIGLLQGGVPARVPGIEALATVFVEPYLVYVRTDREVSSNPALWRGLIIARGNEGSGTRTAADELLGALDLMDRNTMADLGGRAATDALLAGDVDVAIYVAVLDAGYLEPLQDTDAVRLLTFDHIDAISLRLPYSRIAVVPSGAMSLDPVKPAETTLQVALWARLAAVEDLHPAVVDRLVLAARKIHGDADIFSRQGLFPTAEAVDMPIDAGALKLLAEGQSNFHAWLPYWIAAQIRRVLLVIVPLFFLVIPMIRALPGIYRWSMNRRIWRYYTEVRMVEMDLAVAEDDETLRGLDARLIEIDKRLVAMRLPPAFRGGAYNARLHVEMVRRRIADRLGESAGPRKAIAGMGL